MALAPPASGRPSGRAPIDLDADLPDVADWILQEFAALSRCSSATLYLQTADGFSPSYARPQLAAAATWPRGPLLKWLRVNESAASLADPRLLDDLSDAEKAFAAAQQLRISVPLVFRDVLEGIVALSGEMCADRAADLARLTDRARTVAPRWHRAIERRDASRHRERAYRSEQLATAGQLAATVAHEVRNPLSAVRSVVQLVRDGGLEESRRSSLLSGVLSEVDRIDEHVANLLGLARVHPARPARQAVVPVIHEAVRFMDAYMRGRGLEMQAAGLTSCDAVFDAKELRQVLLNVLLNACQACRRGDSIRLGVDAVRSAGAPVVEIRIEDSGPGMDDATMARVFEGFFTTKDGGTGLGLVTSRDLLRGAGGDLLLESVPGQGTRVTLRLPTVPVPDGPSADH